MDFISELKAAWKKSHAEKVEYAGSFHFTSNKLEIIKTSSGEIDNVRLPFGKDTWHTHPRSCRSLQNCSLHPPSAEDMGIFAQHSEHCHAVVSKDCTYFLQCAIAPSQLECKSIKKYFEILEQFADEMDNMEDLEVYHDTWVAAVKQQRIWYLIIIQH